MNYHRKTDLEIARDLELLCQTVDEAIAKANSILQRAQQIDEVRNLIQRIDSASQDLKQSEKQLQEIRSECELKLQQLLSVQSDLEHFWDLPETLRQLGIHIHENLLPEVQRILDDLQISKKEAEELIQRVASHSHDLMHKEQKLQQVEKDCELKLQQLKQAQLDLESARNLLARLNQLGIKASVSQHMQSILDEMLECQHQFEQVLDDLKGTKQEVEGLIHKTENIAQNLDKV